MRACWLKWVGRDWSISADYIWLNYSGANNKRVLPFFHECNDVYLGVLLIGLRGMPWNASAVELRFEAP